MTRRLTAILIYTSAFALIVEGSRGQEPELAKDREQVSVEDLIETLRRMEPPELTYDELAEASDLIVIAKLKSKSAVERLADVAGEFGKGSTELISNQLQILSVLKGVPDEQVSFMTLEWKPKVVVLVRNKFAQLRSKLPLPQLSAFEVEGEITGYGKVNIKSKTYTIEPEYLLYLKRIEDGIYVAVTGQRYSALSVRFLNGYYP
ncbi:MAG: hypothetical protein AAF664_16830 [Planctomycetota bacterium]